jgi:DNA-binding transcriptional MocR family regulator
VHTLAAVAPISFQRGLPAPECLPVDELAECARAAILEHGRTILNYGPAGGFAPLRERIAADYGVVAGRIFVTNGSLQALSLLAGVLVEPGARVLVEGPTYDRALHILARVGAQAVPIPVDDEGLDVEALERELSSPAAFLYTIPTFQNPSGNTTSLSRRRRLAELARERRILVLEDDPYRHVRFDGDDLPSLYELTGGEGVVHSSSFSKIVAPGIRVASLVAPEELVKKLEALAAQTYLAPSFVPQATIFEFLRRGHLDASLTRVRDALRPRRDAMLEALERELGDRAEWSRPQGGYFLWLDLRDDVDARELAPRAEAAGVAVIPGADFFPGGGAGTSSLRLAYSFVATDEIAEGVARLAAAIAAGAPRAAAV